MSKRLWVVMRFPVDKAITCSAESIRDDFNGSWRECIEWIMREEGPWFPMTDLISDDGAIELVSVEEDP